MSTAQLNIRLDTQLKREGDATLARLGVSATDAIRALWTYLAQKHELPSFMRDERKPSSASPSEVSLQGAGLAVRMANDLGIEPPPQTLGYDELRDLAFQEMVEEGKYRV